MTVQGVPVDGYLQWTISDNWEWADGYCPKFGIVDVDRADNLARHPRPSYYLYQQVTIQISPEMLECFEVRLRVLTVNDFRHYSIIPLPNFSVGPDLFVVFLKGIYMH